MLRGQFIIASTGSTKNGHLTAVLKSGDLFIDANVNKSFEVGEVVEGVIFENIVKYINDGKDSFFLARSFVLSEDNVKKK